MTSEIIILPKTGVDNIGLRLELYGCDPGTALNSNSIVLSVDENEVNICSYKAAYVTLRCFLLGYYFLVWWMLDGYFFTTKHANVTSQEHNDTRDDTVVEVRTSLCLSLILLRFFSIYSINY